ncbi:MAG: D-2-hydroxyacid dehydrogenase [Lachnospiraceae bacterium]|nr:D-2-hydroxyacid dehydrogenase [Lachnospiraceae bacterium]
MKILVIGSEFEQRHIDLIKDTAQKIKADVCFVNNEDEIGDDFRDAEVIYGFGLKTAAASKDLKWLCVPSAGVDYLLKPGVFANEDCIITNSAGAYGVSIAEHIIMVSLMMMRQMNVIYKSSIQGIWENKLPQRSLKNCRITVLGTGDIGRNFAKRARAFDPKSIIGVNRSGRCDEPAFDRIVKIDELDNVLLESELLVMCLPDTDETKGILSRERLELLPKGAYIVNVGRGSAIDEDALADRLESSDLGGAALDVFANEPLPKDSRLWKTKNLIITPHVAGNLTLRYTLDKNVEMFVEDLVNYAKNRPLKHLIDKNRGY